MAGKVAQIRELMAGDNLARQLSGLYNNWWIQRREKELELLEYEKGYKEGVSRLGCQIFLTKELDGLILYLKNDELL